MDKFLLTCWDGDIYILTGYKSVAEIRERIAGMEWVTMPNGSDIKQSSIAKIQSLADYQFQQEQKHRHKRGQYLRGSDWHEVVGGYVTGAEIKSITGELKNLPSLKLSTPNVLPKGK